MQRDNQRRIVEIGACQSRMFLFIFLVFVAIIALIGLNYFNQLNQIINNDQLQKLIKQQEDLITYYDHTQLFDYASEKAGASIGILNSNKHKFNVLRMSFMGLKWNQTIDSNILIKNHPDAPAYFIDDSIIEITLAFEIKLSFFSISSNVYHHCVKPTRLDFLGKVLYNTFSYFYFFLFFLFFKDIVQSFDYDGNGTKNKQYFAFSQQEEITKTIKIMVHGTNICISKITIHGEGAKEKKDEI